MEYEKTPSSMNIEDRRGEPLPSTTDELRDALDRLSKKTETGVDSIGHKPDHTDSPSTSSVPLPVGLAPIEGMVYMGEPEPKSSRNRAALKVECSRIAESDLIDANLVTASETKPDGTHIEFNGLYDRTTRKLEDGTYDETGKKGTKHIEGKDGAKLGQKYANKCPKF